MIFNDIAQTFSAIIRVVMWILITGGILMLIINYFRYLDSTYDSTRHEKLRSSLLLTTGGIITLVVSIMILNGVIGFVFGDPQESRVVNPVVAHGQVVDVSLKEHIRLGNYKVNVTFSRPVIVASPEEVRLRTLNHGDLYISDPLRDWRMTGYLTEPSVELWFGRREADGPLSDESITVIGITLGGGAAIKDEDANDAILSFSPKIIGGRVSELSER